MRPLITCSGLLVLLCTVGSGQAYSCPSPSGLFSNPADCATYYHCLNGRAYKKPCPPGLLFDPASTTCNWASAVDCKSSGPTAAPGPRPRPTSRPNPPPRPATTPSSTVTNGCSSATSEPINAEIRNYRQRTCTLDNASVERVRPGASSNPANVKVLEKILPQSKFKSLFPRANAAYTYINFLKAVAKYPAVCSTPDYCRRALATMFAHFQQETAGLYYLKEINKSPYCATWSNWVVKAYPCSQGQMYFGRGAKQLSWNYNYGAFSQAMYGDAKVLLDNPDLVSDTWLNFAASMWFFVTPQPPKPSMLDILEKRWTPNGADLAGNRKPGFGATIMVINGAQECGGSPPNRNGAANRIKWYKKYAAMFNIDISGEKLDCADMQAFNEQGSANPKLYWGPSSGCQIVKWQTAYSTLVQGDYQRCKAGN